MIVYLVGGGAEVLEILVFSALLVLPLALLLLESLRLAPLGASVLEPHLRNNTHYYCYYWLEESLIPLKLVLDKDVIFLQSRVLVRVVILFQRARRNTE